VNTGDDATIEELNRILSEFSQDQASRDAEELMSQLDSVFEELFSDAERYQILPIEMRDFLEANPDSMFTFARKMHSAILSNMHMVEIRSLLERNSESSTLYENCENCISRLLLEEIRKIVQDD
jgi:DNA-binding GntR family transcriptional regulator